MNLSTAIRLGAEQSLQAFHAYQHTRTRRSGVKVVSTCALGAAYLGYMGRPRKPADDAIVRTLDKAFPSLNTLWPKSELPPCRCRSPLDVSQMSVKRVIMHLNDGHEMTREQIADALDEAGLG